MTVVGEILVVLLWLFLILLLGRLVMDYVMMFARSYQPRGVVLVLVEFAYTTTDPPLKLLRRFIPPLRLGGVSIDVSFIILFIIVQILIRVAYLL
jgi:YggT family protein